MGDLGILGLEMVLLKLSNQQVHLHGLATRSYTVPRVEGPEPGVTLCCHCLEIFNTFLIRISHVHCAYWTLANCIAGPANQSTPKTREK